MIYETYPKFNRVGQFRQVRRQNVVLAEWVNKASKAVKREKWHVSVQATLLQPLELKPCMQVLLDDIQNISNIQRSRTLSSGLKAKCRFGRLGQQGLKSRETVKMACHVQATLLQPH